MDGRKVEGSSTLESHLRPRPRGWMLSIPDSRPRAVRGLLVQKLAIPDGADFPWEELVFLDVEVSLLGQFLHL